MALQLQKLPETSVSLEDIAEEYTAVAYQRQAI